ncbi:MAG: Holliday junction resolvase RuvX, partial [Litorilinea sp.]
MTSDLETPTTTAKNSVADSPVDTTADTAHRVAGVGLHPGPLHGKPAKLLALDVGLARIGIAVCDPLQLAARPLATLHRSSRRADFATLAETITRQEAQAIICGLPLNMDGSEGPQAISTRKWALRFAQAMRTLLQRSLPLIFWDERLSSYAAQNIMHAESAGKPQTAPRVSQQHVSQQEDAVAAAV